MSPKDTEGAFEGSMAEAMAILETADAYTTGTAPDAPADVSSSPIACSYSGIALARYAKIAEALPDLPDDHTIQIVHHGGFSTDQLLLRILEIIGPAHMRIATWAISTQPAMHLAAAKAEGYILGARILVDWQTLLHHGGKSIDVLIATFGRENLKLLQLHSKAYWLENASASVSVIGSSNLTDNPRVEILNITRSASAGAFWRDWFDRTWKRAQILTAFRSKQVDANPDQCLTILRGIPGSGKTTWRLANVPETTIVFSRDDFMTNPLTGLYEWTPDAEIAYRRHKYRNLQRTIYKKKPAIVIDNTNIHLDTFAPDVAAAKLAGYTVRVLRFDTPIEVCLQRQTHNVPEQVVRKMAADFEDYPGEEIIKHVDR